MVVHIELGTLLLLAIVLYIGGMLTMLVLLAYAVNRHH